MPVFGQIVVGPPGSGKTTYCDGMQQVLQQLGRRPLLVNLDPANDKPPYEAEVSISDLVALDDVMEGLGLGPNGGLVYCIEQLAENVDWLVERLQAAGADRRYVIFDCPGQAELYTHNEGMATIIKALAKALDARLAAVHLVDAHHCSDPGKYVAAALLSLNTMMRLELPHVNVLSKVDLIELYGQLPFPVEFFTNADDLEPLGERLLEEASRPVVPASAQPTAVDTAPVATASLPQAPATPPAATADGSGQPSTAPAEALSPGGVGSRAPPALDRSWGSTRRKYAKLQSELVGVLSAYSLVDFLTLNIQDQDSVLVVLRRIDRANGYAVGMLGEQSAGGGGSGTAAARLGAVRELVGRDEEHLEAQAAQRVKELYTTTYGAPEPAGGVATAAAAAAAGGAPARAGTGTGQFAIP